MQAKYKLVARFRNHTTASAIDGGATMRRTDLNAIALLGRMMVAGKYDTLDEIDVIKRNGSAVAAYAGHPEDHPGHCGFEVRGITTGPYGTTKDIKLSEHTFLRDAESALGVMERGAHRWQDWTQLFVCSALNPSFRMDAFCPADSARWNCWFRDLLKKSSAPYLVVLRPQHGICQAVEKYLSFDDAITEFQQIKENPRSQLHGLQRYVLLIDAQNGAVLDSLDVVERLEEIEEGLSVPGADIYRAGYLQL